MAQTPDVARAVVTAVDPDGFARRHGVAEHVSVISLASSPEQLARRLDRNVADLVIVDMELPEGQAIDAIREVDRAHCGVLAVIPDPLELGHASNAIAAGAHACVTHRGLRDDPSAAVAAAVERRPFLPTAELYNLLAAEGGEEQLTAAQRSDRLRNLVIAMIPLAGLGTALVSLLWRRYLGTIGVRPVDLAIDPGTRIVDVFFTLSILLGLFGPLAFVGSWLDLIRNSPSVRFNRFVTRHARWSRLLVSLGVLLCAALLADASQLLFALVVGPTVGMLLLAKMFDLDDDLPAVLRITRLDSSRAIAGAIAVAVLLVAVLSYEVIVRGPSFNATGETGWLAPGVLGFNAQPVQATVVDDGSMSDMLYLGGNADLYVLVDPCDGDRVDLVSVGSTKLTVIDRVECE